MWDKRYNTDEYVYGTEPNGFLKSAAAKIPAGKVLCLGEGEGRNAVYLAELGHQVTAVDSSSVGLQKARKLAEDRGVSIETIAADIEQYSIEPEHWDAIVSIFFHLMPEPRRSLHQQVVGGLRPGGVFILEAYTVDQLNYKTGGPKTEELMMSLEALKAELEGLDFAHGVEMERDLVEGKLHTGKGAVVQILAFKP
ncbi:MAG: class I SAM-dependent methyltransferase [FCB group bacterium]|nr:class I SAM-dependent methyltransferase [FCB group bacterium]